MMHSFILIFWMTLEVDHVVILTVRIQDLVLECFL